MNIKLETLKSMFAAICGSELVVWASMWPFATSMLKAFILGIVGAVGGLTARWVWHGIKRKWL